MEMEMWKEPVKINAVQSEKMSEKQRNKKQTKRTFISLAVKK